MLKLLGNILWFVFAGLILFLCWSVIGLLWCITVIGIPVGVQAFKFAWLALWPFGKTVVYCNRLSSLLLNILWILFGGIETALVAAVIGCALCLTVVGIPFGVQCFKIAQLALMPFGATIENA